MKNRSRIGLQGLLAFSIFVSACAVVPTVVNVASAGNLNSDGIMPTRLIVKGENDPASVEGAVALMNGGRLRKVLKGYGGHSNPANMGIMIIEIRTSNESSPGSVPGMTGPGGVFGHAFLNMAQNALKPNGKFNQNGARIVISVSGKITDYGYNSGDGSGKLHVTTYFTRRVVTPGVGAPPTKIIDTFRWEIQVEEGGFRVIQKDDCEGKYFCDVIKFSQEMKDRADSLGFTHKLWAGPYDNSGTGSKIKIMKLWHNGDEKFATDDEYAGLFQTTPYSCIDMMFVDSPPAIFADLEGPPMYCLGRCDQPLIINTGM